MHRAHQPGPARALRRPAPPLRDQLPPPRPSLHAPAFGGPAAPPPPLARAALPGVRREPGRAEVRLPDRGRLPALRPRIPGPHPALQRLVAGDRYARHGAGLSHGPQHEPLRGGGAPLRPRDIPRRRDRRGINDERMARTIERSTLRYVGSSWLVHPPEAPTDSEPERAPDGAADAHLALPL